jgi:DNA-binding PucR family transcriptional regulator
LAIVPDPDGPGRRAALERAVGDRTAALGSDGAPSEFALSWTLARAALVSAEAGALPAQGLLAVDDVLSELLLVESPIAARIAGRGLAPFEGLSAKAAERMRSTALSYLRQRGNSVAMAAELHVHPQTARYRIARLRELLGERLDDPDARFELEVALRAGRLSDAAGAAAS